MGIRWINENEYEWVPDEDPWAEVEAQSPQVEEVDNSPEALAAAYPELFGGQSQPDLTSLMDTDIASAADMSRVGELKSPSWMDSLAKVFNVDSSKGLFENLLDAASSKAGMATLGALMGYMNKAEKRGGGTGEIVAAPIQYARETYQGKYGPLTRVVKKAATGGIMQAYAQGGPVAMEDGGFVMTAEATEAAEDLFPQGIAQLAPGAKMIRGPGNGTSDSIPAYIQGRNGRTPALVSNGESYLSKADVDRLGGTRAAYDLMHALERRA